MSNSIFTAFVLSCLIVALALWRGSLSPSGGVTAVIIGTLTMGLGGWVWGVLLALFFVTSSLLSHFKEEQKRTAAEKFEKGYRRDSGQVLANGVLGALTAVASAIWPSPVWLPLFVGVMATVTADTWATEIGTLARQPPRLITNGRIVEVGTSGGISPLGTIISFCGGLLIGATAGLFSPELGFLVGGLIGAVGGLSGSLFDSLLGATVQQIYFCDQCQKETERQRHKCGSVTRPLRGWPWLNNDLVNLLSSAVGGIVALTIFVLV